MHIVKVTKDPYDRYIPLRTWNAVGYALHAYSTGEAKGSRATQLHQVQAMDQAYGASALEVMAKFEKIRYTPSQFVQRLLTEAELTLSPPARDSWSRHYDYDGVGVFFKTSVDILVLDRPSAWYAVGIWAAYVGDEPEKGLAELLQVPRALMRTGVSVETAPIDQQRFTFDFDDIAQRLSAVFNSRLQGKALAKAMVSGDGLSSPSVTVYQDAAFQVDLSMGAIESRFNYRRTPGRPYDTWIVKGSQLTGYMRESYSEPGTPAQPSFIVTIRAASGDKYSKKPIWRPEHKQYAHALTDKIANAMSR
jgi:hypothetical protein